MSGTELQQHLTFSYEMGSGGMSRLWASKEAEAREPKGARSEHGGSIHGAGIYDSLRSEGYQGQHVLIHQVGRVTPNQGVLREPKSGERYVGDAHHRIAGAAGAERDTGHPIYIPLEYEDPTKKRKEARIFSYEHRYPQNIRGDDWYD